MEGVFIKHTPIFFLEVYCCAVALILNQLLCCSPLFTFLYNLSYSVDPQCPSVTLHKMLNFNTRWLMSIKAKVGFTLLSLFSSKVGKHANASIYLFIEKLDSYSSYFRSPPPLISAFFCLECKSNHLLHIQSTLCHSTHSQRCLPSSEAQTLNTTMD